MKLSDILTVEHILFLEATKKNKALDTMLTDLEKDPAITDTQAFHKGIYHRENLMSTGIGLGVGIPHVRLDSILKPVLCAGICQEGLFDYDSLDNRPVQLIFMIAAGKNQHTEHIRLLSQVSTCVKDPTNRKALLSSLTPEAFHKHLINFGV